MADLAFISSFLNRPGIEGPRQTCGYVPARPRNYTGRDDPQNFTAIGASGVTIATGVDLGQKDMAELAGYGVPDDLLAILSPYLGLKKDAAILKLHTHPLRLEPPGVSLLDRAVHGGYLDRFVRPAFERMSGVSFDALPKEAQAVVFSLLYHKGPGAAKSCPKTWQYLTECDWAAASQELQTGFTQYPGRRRLEGKLLETLL